MQPLSKSDKFDSECTVVKASIFYFKNVATIDVILPSSYEVLYRQTIFCVFAFSEKVHARYNKF